MKRKRTFLVGRRTSRSTLLLMVERVASPIAGPWLLRAVVVE
jgi:hypothetical protein